MEGFSVQYCCANYIPLSPISFVERASSVYADKTSIIYGTLRFSWRQTYGRCLKIASALTQLGITRNDTVATLAPNIPAHYELHFGVPMAGAIISALNTMSDAATLAFLLQQIDAKLIFVDYQFVDIAIKALETVPAKKGNNPPRLVIIPECDQQATSSLPHKRTYTGLSYDDLLAMGGSEFQTVTPDSEFDPISVNFTSGSTGDPKGVVYSHRAAYLNSLAAIFRFDMRQMPVLLWTVDMFRCNGWCLTWAMAALGGTNICIRNVTSEIIFNSVSLHKVTNICGPPSILNIIAAAEPNQVRQIPRRVNVIVAGALPNSSVLTKVEQLGFNVIYGYGMTEALGPAIVRPLESESDSRVIAHEHETSKCLEGLHNPLIEGVDVKDPNTMESVPHDGKTIGEVMFRSNVLMSGYLKNPEATKEAFRGGWYHTGDLGVRHPSGFIQMKDRARDIINAGGESVSSLEVEAVLLSHPGVCEAAVVAKPDADLKEVPCAFVKLKEGCGASAEELIKFCEGRLPDNMTPKSIVFGDLPVNFTGKVQKYFLREKASAKNIVA